MQHAPKSSGGSRGSSVTTGSEKQYETLTCTGYVTESSGNCGYIAVWKNGLHYIYFRQKRIKEGSLVQVTAEFNDEHRKYNAISVELLELDVRSLKPNISSIGVVVSSKTLTLVDIATGLAVRLQGSELNGSNLICHDLVHFNGMLDCDLKHQYRARFVRHSGLKSPQFGIITKVPTGQQAGELRTLCNGSVMAVTFAGSLPVRRYQRIVFDADIDIESMKLEIKNVEVLAAPSKPEKERKRAKGVVIEATKQEGMIMDTADFIAASFDPKQYDFPVGCEVVYSAKLQDPQNVTYTVTHVSLESRKRTSSSSCPIAQIWEQEAISHLKERLQKHECIRISNLSGHWQQTSETVRNKMKDPKKCRAFLARNSSIFKVSKADEVTLRGKEEEKPVERHEAEKIVEPDQAADLEQEAVNYLVKCLEKHGVVPKKNLSGFLSQASIEVRDLLNSSPDKFLERHACFFNVSDVGEISLRNFGSFTITPDLESLGLIGGVLDVPASISPHVPAPQQGPILTEHRPMYDYTVPESSRWNTGKTVDKLFGPSSATSSRQGDTSQPMKLLQSWEVSARQFLEEKLEKYEQIYLMNLHSHMQHAPDNLKTRLRGQEAQRKFLLAHPDLFKLDQADLITLRHPRSEQSVKDPVQEKAQPNENPSNVQGLASHVDLPPPLTETKSEEGPGNGTLQAMAPDSDEKPTSYVKVMDGLTLKNIPVTRSEYNALKYIAAKFEEHKLIERRNICSHFSQASPFMGYNTRQQADMFLAKFPDIFKDTAGYLSMTKVRFPDSGESTNITGKASGKIETPETPSPVLFSPPLSEPEIAVAKAYFPMSGESTNITGKASAKIEMPGTPSPVLFPPPLSEPEIGSYSFEKRTGTEHMLEGLRRVTVLGSSKHDLHLRVTQLEYEALKYIKTRFNVHGTIERHKLMGHFAQSPENVRAAYQNKQGPDSLVEKFPQVFINRKGFLTMSKLDFHDSPEDLSNHHHKNHNQAGYAGVTYSKLSESLAAYSEHDNEPEDDEPEDVPPDKDNDEPKVERWEIEAKAFIVSKLTKHKQIQLKNLHSHFAGAPRSMCFKLSDCEKQRAFLLSNADLFRLDQEDVLTLADTAIYSWPKRIDSETSYEAEPESLLQMKEFVGIGQISCLFQGSQSGLVQDLITGETVHLKGKNCGFKHRDLLDVFPPDSYVAFKAGPRPTGVTHRNGILRIQGVDETEVNSLKVIIETLKESEPMSVQDLAKELPQTGRDFLSTLSTDNHALEQFLRKHSILFSLRLGLVSLHSGEAKMKKCVEEMPAEKWFKAIVRTRNGKIEDYVRKSEFLVLQYVRKALETPNKEVEFSYLHELFLASPKPGSQRLKTVEQAQAFVRKHPDIFQVNGDKVSMAHVTFTQRREAMPAALQGPVSANAVSDHASISSIGSKVRHDSGSIAGTSDNTAYHMTHGNERYSSQPSTRPRVPSPTWGGIDEVALVEQSSEGSSEEYSDSSSSSSVSETLPESSPGIGKILSVYPRNGQVQDVFTDDIIILLQALLPRESAVESLSDEFCVGDFVAYSSIERANASKYKRGISEIQKIEAPDLERVSHIVVCLREVESMTIDALLVYLNEASPRPLSQACTMETLAELVERYSLLFDDTDGMVALKIEISEDAVQWRVPECVVRLQNAVADNKTPRAAPSQLDGYDKNAGQGTQDTNQVPFTPPPESESSEQEGKNLSHVMTGNGVPAADSNKEHPMVAEHQEHCPCAPDLDIDDDSDDLDIWDEEEFDSTTEKVFVPHLTEESMKNFMPASDALCESGRSVASWHTATELEGISPPGAVENKSPPTTVHTEHQDHTVETKKQTPHLIQHEAAIKLDSTQKHNNSEPNKKPSAVVNQTIPTNSSTGSSSSIPAVKPQTESSLSIAEPAAAVRSPDPEKSPIFPVDLMHQERESQGQGRPFTESQGQGRPYSESQGEGGPHAEPQNQGHPLTSDFLPPLSEEASLIWANHRRVRSTIAGDRGVCEGFGTICAVLAPSVVVLLEGGRGVGVFTMPEHQPHLMPSLDARVRYLAREVAGSKQVRWLITDLFIEHHIISAFGSAIESNMADKAVQTEA